jgi:hypothetical protein
MHRSRTVCRSKMRSVIYPVSKLVEIWKSYHRKIDAAMYHYTLSDLNSQHQTTDVLVIFDAKNYSTLHNRKLKEKVVNESINDSDIQ